MIFNRLINNNDSHDKNNINNNNDFAAKPIIIY